MALPRLVAPALLITIAIACAPDVSVGAFEDLIGCYSAPHGRPVFKIRPDHRLIGATGVPLGTANLERRKHTTWLQLRPGLKWSIARGVLVPTGELSETHFAISSFGQTLVALHAVEADEPPVGLRQEPFPC